ncbi:hypothetical protein MTO96_035957, partial [Rhipicephalus appendiculatus]
VSSKAYCWNELYGCDFVGPIAGVLQHYEQDCAFHVFPCQRCGEIMRIDMLAAHYIGRCNHRSSSATLPECPRRDDDATVPGGVNSPSGSVSEEEQTRDLELTRIEHLECKFDALVEIVDTITDLLDQTEKRVGRLEM